MALSLPVPGLPSFRSRPRAKAPAPGIARRRRNLPTELHRYLSHAFKGACVTSVEEPHYVCFYAERLRPKEFGVAIARELVDWFGPRGLVALFENRKVVERMLENPGCVVAIDRRGAGFEVELWQRS